MLKGKDPFMFVRYGGLDLKNQDGYLADESKKTFHSPPCRRGIYAMPQILIERFLITNITNSQPSSFPSKKNRYEGKHKEKWEKHWKPYYQAVYKKFRKDSGCVWHHLESRCDPSDILDRNGAWVKTEMKVWAKAVSKESVTCRANTEKEMGYSMGLAGAFSKDHFEVFFDEKVS
jgi:hypothetical protein